MKTETYQLTAAEAALISLMRQLGEGFIEGVGVVKGQPTTLRGVTQRLDLSKAGDLQQVVKAQGGTLLIALAEPIEAEPDPRSARSH